VLSLSHTNPSKHEIMRIVSAALPRVSLSNGGGAGGAAGGATNNYTHACHDSRAHRAREKLLDWVVLR